HAVLRGGLVHVGGDDEEEDGVALDVLEEADAEATPLARALDDAGDVRHHERAVVTEVDHPEVRLERRERVVRDLRLRGRERRDQRALPRVRETDESDVGEELELEGDVALFAGLAGLGVLRGLARSALEVDVPEAAAPALREHEAVAV